ncbi:toxin-antitoxin system YwqK family antitoxin [Costertonia aggregata]|uniref:Toxin-antitoxin system YwqK family antitoxin n=1 Tax=Costertonia aggregata TaxID=343403 RepID=A0A7H9ARG3_9FLAO|nr:hypothetical protein [Costertonia aggregata]QLG46009.1 hypothetical protein HYG79_11850 [Costertonia aggregata]
MKLKSNKTLGLLNIIFLFAISTVSAQNDTIFYDAKWKPTVKDSASFYRPPIKSEGNLFRVKDYYISGKIQMEALSKSAEKDIWENKATWYNEDGSVFQQATYKDNRLQGDFITYMGTKKLVAKYENGRFVSGKRNNPLNSGQFYMEKTGDSLKEIFYDKDIDGIRYEYFRPNNGSRSVSKYYGKNGGFIGEQNILPNGGTKGLYVSYYYSPMRVRSIQYYKEGYVFGSTVYYPNGQIREKFIQEPVYSKEFFRPDGTQLGKVVYSVDRNYLKPENGVEYLFYNSNKTGAEDRVQSIRIYKEGKLVSQATYHENGKLKQKETFSKGVKESQVSYDQEGKEIARITYSNYVPQNGVEIIGDRKSEYKDGKLILQEVFYPKTNILFSKRQDKTETYYDKEGKMLASLVFQEDYYSKPISGKRYSIDYEGNISRIEVYENSTRTKESSFIILKEPRQIFREDVLYGPDGYTRVKETKFYSNGNKQSEITLKKYDKQKGTYYNKAGELLGNYDFITKEGTFYDFFDASDDVKEMKERKNGQVVRSKLYDLVYDRDIRKSVPVLLEDEDISCCGTYYSRNNKVLGKISFKDGKPFEGKIFDHKTKELFTIKNGQRNGVYQKLGYQDEIEEEGRYIEDLREGIFKYYDYQGNLKHTENYLNGKLDGKAVYYDLNGNVISSLIYKMGSAYDGKKITGSGDYRTEEVFKNGKIVERVRYGKEGKNKTLFSVGDLERHLQYTSDNKTVKYEYTTKNGNLTGEVIKYDEKGTPTNKAVFENGKLVSGKVLLKDNGQNYGVSFISVEKDDTVFKVQYFDENNDIVFNAEEVLKPNSPPTYINSLGLYLDYIAPSKLY